MSYPLTWFRPKHQLALEILALRHQILVLEQQTPRPKLRRSDRCLWVMLSLAGVEDPVDYFPTRDRYRLAKSRIQEVLAMEVPASAWAAGKGPGIGPNHPPDVERQPDLG